MKTKKRTVKDRFIPEFTEKIEQPDFIIYLNKNKILAMAYIGKQSKPVFHYRFQTVEKMEEYCLKWALDTAKYFDKKNENKRKTANIKASEHFKIGDIVYNSWGWEQTNIDFYQVVKITDKKIRVKRIYSNVRVSEYNDMAGYSMPVKNEFHKNGEEFLLSLICSGDKVYISGGKSFYSFHVWDGKEKYCSWYA